MNSQCAKSSKHSKPYLKHRLQIGENPSVSHFQFLCYFQICVMRYYSASTGSPLLHWVQTIFHQNYWQKVHFRKQAFRRFCIWNCEYWLYRMSKKKKKIIIIIINQEKRKGTQNSTAFIGGTCIQRWISCLSMAPEIQNGPYKREFWVDSKSHPIQDFNNFIIP